MSDLRKIVAELDEQGRLLDVTFYFQGSEEPFGISEFAVGSETRQRLEVLAASLQRALESDLG
jgi:hypothetical protein